MDTITINTIWDLVFLHEILARLNNVDVDWLIISPPVCLFHPPQLQWN